MFKRGDRVRYEWEGGVCSGKVVDLDPVENDVLVEWVNGSTSWIWTGDLAPEEV